MKQMKEEIVKEETGEYGDAADLHMVCSDASEFDPVSRKNFIVCGDRISSDIAIYSVCWIGKCGL